MNVVINGTYGGFSLSHAAAERLAQLGHPLAIQELADRLSPEYDKYREFLYDSMLRDIDRSDPLLVQVVQEMGEMANGRCARLKIVEIPDGVDYVIQEYDGSEWIAEKHRTWA
jgi:hypothetical protein